jgi:hypothetical protein
VDSQIEEQFNDFLKSGLLQTDFNEALKSPIQRNTGKEAPAQKPGRDKTLRNRLAMFIRHFQNLKYFPA